MKKIYLAEPRGFCAGVERAIEIVERAIDLYPGRKVVVNHEIVHNKYVVENFESRGVVFTDDLDDVANDSVYIFSAHGVSPVFRKKVAEKNLLTIDATCPLVTKVHWEAEKFSKEGYYCFYIGQENHQEYLGVAGVCDLHLLESVKDVEKLSSQQVEKFKDVKVVCLSQTTLSVEDTDKVLEKLREKIPHVRVPGDICYATTNRQEAVKKLVNLVDFLVVIGSESSSNTKKLVSVAEKSGLAAERFEGAGSINVESFQNFEKIGITSGASVPDALVQEVVEKFRGSFGEISVEVVRGREENLHFPLPKEVKS